MIDSKGSKGLTVTEIWKRLGLNNKRNYYRLTNMVSRFGLHLQAGSHKRSMLYRVWTPGNLNSYGITGPGNNQQHAHREVGTSELGLDGGKDLVLMGDSYNASSETCPTSMKRSQNKRVAPQRGRLKIKINR